MISSVTGCICGFKGMFIHCMRQVVTPEINLGSRDETLVSTKKNEIHSKARHYQKWKHIQQHIGKSCEVTVMKYNQHQSK